MAFSDWAEMVITKDGYTIKSLPKDFEVYKNYLVYRGSVKVVMREGLVQVDDYGIFIKKGPQDGILFVIEYDGKWIAGIGCSGFGSLENILAEKMGLDIEGRECCAGSTSDGDGKHFHELWVISKDGDIEEEYLLPDDGEDINPWIGIKESTHKEFVDFLMKYTEEGDYRDKKFKTWAKKLDIKKFRSIGQGLWGDRYKRQRVF